MYEVYVLQIDKSWKNTKQCIPSVIFTPENLSCLFNRNIPSRSRVDSVMLPCNSSESKVWVHPWILPQGWVPYNPVNSGSMIKGNPVFWQDPNKKKCHNFSTSVGIVFLGKHLYFGIICFNIYFVGLPSNNFCGILYKGFRDSCKIPQRSSFLYKVGPYDRQTSAGPLESTWISTVPIAKKLSIRGFPKNCGFPQQTHRFSY